MWISKLISDGVDSGVGVVVQVGHGGGMHGVAVAVGVSVSCSGPAVAVGVAVGCTAVGAAVAVSVKVGVIIIERAITQGVAVFGGVGVLVGRVHGSIVGVAEAGMEVRVGVGVADGVLVTLTV